jgi:hypothetical protein
MQDETFTRLIDLGSNGFMAAFLWLMWNELKATNAWVREMFARQDAAADERERLRDQLADLEAQMSQAGIAPRGRDATNPRRSPPPSNN